MHSRLLDPTARQAYYLQVAFRMNATRYPTGIGQYISLEVGMSTADVSCLVAREYGAAALRRKRPVVKQCLTADFRRTPNGLLRAEYPYCDGVASLVILNPPKGEKEGSKDVRIVEQIGPSDGSYPYFNVIV